MPKSKSVNVGLMLCSALLSAAFPALLWSAEDVVTIEGTRIRGDQELPTVLYLVPWQPPVVQSLPPSSGHFMLQQALEPLERAQFQRLLSYHQRFKVLHNQGEKHPGQESAQ